MKTTAIVLLSVMAGAGLGSLVCLMWVGPYIRALQAMIYKIGSECGYRKGQVSHATITRAMRLLPGRKK